MAIHDLLSSSLLKNVVIDPAADAVVIDHVSKTFKKDHVPLRPFWKPRGPAVSNRVYAIADISLTVRPGEIVGILGANGSGKSTLIRMLSTLLIPDEGRISVFGHDVVKEEAIVQRLINRVSVEASFFKKLSPMENLLYAARLYNLSGREARERIRSTLKRLGIKPDRIGGPLEHMSRGMQQKVAIARAFLTSPILLLLDEPTTGLDPRSKIDVQTFVHELRDVHGATILITTHDMDEADGLCDRVAIVDKGRMVALGPASDLKYQVAHLKGRAEPVSMNEVFMHYTAAHLITDAEVSRYGSWEKAFEALEAEQEEEMS